MPAHSPSISPSGRKALRALGEQLRNRRKRLKISATATAESASISRTTLHRIERGDPSVTMGAYLAAISALGLELSLFDPARQHTRIAPIKLPPKIRLADYPQLKRLAWQLKKTAELSPEEALDIYERNWRHIDLKALTQGEQELIEMLLAAFGKERLLV